MSLISLQNVSNYLQETPQHKQRISKLMLHLKPKCPQEH